MTQETGLRTQQNKPLTALRGREFSFRQGKKLSRKALYSHEPIPIVVTTNNTKIRLFRERIPTFKCKPGCHDCCGPVTASAEELSQLPVKSDAAHEAALAELNCPYLGENGCEVYEERPLICRLFGTTESLPCPHHQKPEKLLDRKTEERVYAFLANTRQRLL